jgi:rod shape-determining protein MreC
MSIFEIVRRRRDTTVLVVLVILSVSMMVAPQPSKFAAAQTVLDAVLYPFYSVKNYFAGLGSVRSENRELRRMVATLLHERERLVQFRDERERLRRLAAFKEEQFLNLVPSEVVGKNLDRYQTTIVIDKGAADAIRERMPVLSYEGYVGRVSKVFPNSSWVQLICSRNNPVSCLDKRSRVVGVLEWVHFSNFELKHVSVVDDVQAGDTLITSGFGGVAPKGFPVAVVTKVKKQMDGVSLKVEASSDIDFRSLEEVFVVRDLIPWNRAIVRDESDSTLIRAVIGKDAEGGAQ